VPGFVSDNQADILVPEGTALVKYTAPPGDSGLGVVLLEKKSSPRSSQMSAVTSSASSMSKHARTASTSSRKLTSLANGPGCQVVV